MDTNNETVKALKEEMEVYKEMVSELRTELQADKEESDLDIIERELKLLHDPFTTQNPLKILAHPPGKRLGWKSPELRKSRRMRGWTFVQWGDEIGRGLQEYIGEPPPRIAEHEQSDSLVRHGDLCLAWIDEEIYHSRVRRAELLSARARGQLSDNQSKMLAKGVVLGPGGLTEDTTPLQGISKKRADTFESGDFARTALPVKKASEE